MNAPAASLVKVSPSAAGTFLDCPRRYRHEYIDSPRPAKWGGPWAHFDVGNAAHLALAEWWDLPLERQVHPAAARNLIAKHWKDRAFESPESAAQWKIEITRWVADYLETLDAVHRPVGIERTVSTIEQGMNLTGKADRIDQRGNRLVVVDYKTGKHELADSDAEASPALAVYALAAGRTFGVRCDRAELHHLPTGSVAVVEYDRARIMRQIERLRSGQDDIARNRTAAAEVLAAGGDAADAAQAMDDAFPAVVSPLCGSCPYRKVCPPGATIPEAAPWQYLPDLDTAPVPEPVST